MARCPRAAPAAAAGAAAPPPRTYAHDPAHADVLAVMVLQTRGDMGFGQIAGNVKQHIMPDTPSILYICVPDHDLSRAQAAAKDLGDFVKAVALSETGWGALPEGNDHALYAGPWGKEYRLMGDWRLWHMPSWAHSIGHKYTLQVDMDSAIQSRIGYNIVQKFRSEKLYMGARKVHIRDIPAVVWGLAELLRFYIVSEGVVPAGRLLTNYTHPGDLSGLYTVADLDYYYSDSQRAAIERLPIPKKSPYEFGWQSAYLHGNFVVLDLDFYMQPIVTRFIHLCRVSGGSMRFRWNEQSVVGAIFQTFVPDANFHQFKFHYSHAGVVMQEGEV